MTKKNEVAERTVNEKRFCKKCEYYYSEFFTCPICYGEKRAEERFLKLLEETKATFLGTAQDYVAPSLDLAIAIIKGMNATNFTGSTLPISQDGEEAGK